MRKNVALGLLVVLLVFVFSCGKKRSSYNNSSCARCGCGGHTEWESGVKVRDDVFDTEISRWLAAFRSGTCEHVWIPVSGWSSDNNLAWDGVSFWTECLSYIKELHPVVGDDGIKELLGLYYAILDMDDGKAKNDKFEAFRGELESKLKNIGKNRVEEI